MKQMLEIANAEIQNNPEMSLHELTAMILNEPAWNKDKIIRQWLEKKAQEIANHKYKVNFKDEIIRIFGLNKKTLVEKLNTEDGDIKYWEEKAEIARQHFKENKEELG